METKIPTIKNGDIVELRYGTICIVVNNMLLNFNNKTWEATLDKTYSYDYLDISGYPEFDIVKVKSSVNSSASDYFNLKDECIDWDWVREERRDSIFTVTKEDLNSEKCITKEEVREIVKEVRETVKEEIIEALKEFIEK